MSGTVWFALAILFQAAAVGMGFRLWGARAEAAGAGLTDRAVLIATATGGLLGAPFWWFDLPASFAWDLPPLASRMLAAAGLAFGVTGCVVLTRPSRARLRYYFVLIAVYLIPLALAILFLHLDRFDFTAPITYGFFAIVALLSAGALLALLRGERAGGEAAARARPVHAAWFALAAAALLLWGVVMFAAPAALPRSLSVWGQDALTSRLIAAMFMTLAVAFALARRDRTLATPALAFGAVYGAGIAAACFVNLIHGLPVPPVYAAVFVSIGLISAALLLSRTPPEAQ